MWAEIKWQMYKVGHSNVIEDSFKHHHIYEKYHANAYQTLLDVLLEFLKFLRI